MDVGKVYIAVIIVLVILIGFVLSIVAVLAKTAGQRIRIDMNRVISKYDEIIENKTQEINNLDENKRNMNYIGEGTLKYMNSSTSDNEKMIQRDGEKIPISVFVKATSKYRNDSLALGYETIKNSFKYTEKEVKNNVKIAENNFEENHLSKPAKSIIKKVSYDKIYNLITIKPDKQLIELDNLLDNTEKNVLNHYIELYGNKNFDSIKFMDWIKRIAKEGSSDVSIRTSSNDDKEEFDPSICDGYQIYVGNKMYDYSISKKDVS